MAKGMKCESTTSGIKCSYDGPIYKAPKVPKVKPEGKPSPVVKNPAVDDDKNWDRMKNMPKGKRY